MQLAQYVQFKYLFLFLNVSTILVGHQMKKYLPISFDLNVLHKENEGKASLFVHFVLIQSPRWESDKGMTVAYLGDDVNVTTAAHFYLKNKQVKLLSEL